MRGLVNVEFLNVRPETSTRKEPLTQLRRGQEVEVLRQEGNWYAIHLSGFEGFVYADFLDLEDLPDEPTPGVVTASRLNVRRSTSTRDDPIGTLARGDEVNILRREGDWLLFRYNGDLAYVYGDYVRVLEESPADSFLFERQRYRDIEMGVRNGSELRGGSAREKQVAGVWNRFGGLLQPLCAELKMHTGAAVAVICVESSGKGFAADGRMLIRFENHVFWKKWGRRHPEIFNKHFRFAASERWKGHEFRETLNTPWQDVHTRNGQSREWQAFEFAYSLDRQAALFSISMGLPQIMGFNYARIGYDAVGEMYTNFKDPEKGQAYQLLGMFDFIRGPGSDSDMLEALRRKQFEQFAASYNGPGQAAKDGDRIESYYETLLSLMA